MTFYIDIIFLENIIMNYIILYTTGLIVQEKISYLRILISSILGATYVIMLYITQLPIYTNVIIKIVLSVVMIYISFYPNILKKLIKNIVIFYLTSFCFGGAAYYLLYNVSPEQIKNINGVLVGEYPIKIAILGGILGAFVIYISFKIVKRKIDKNSIYYKIEIGYNEKNVEVTTLLDTGNLLAEPITKCPVVIIEEKKLLHILDEESLNILKKGQMDKLDYLEEKLKLRCRVIPFNSIGKSNGILLGFKPDYIKLYNDEEKKIINDVIVCTCSNKFNKNKKYSGLIGLELLNSQEGKMGEFNEYTSNIKTKL